MTAYFFRNPKRMREQIIKNSDEYIDESVRAHPEMGNGYPVVVFGEHSFCAGKSTRVQRMPGPHMHSQIELNLVTKGQMTYWFDGRKLTLPARKLALFWGMIPHQVIDCAPNTEFVVLYVPMAVFLELPTLSDLRHAIFGGALIEALDLKTYDFDMFERWRLDLLSGDQSLEPIVRDELTARVRRLDREGWHDLRDVHSITQVSVHHDHGRNRSLKVEAMAQFILENALEDISIEDVGHSVGLHPNYAMTLFKRVLGLSIKQSITRQRLDAARSMLIATDLGTATIAFDCGFRSLSSFYEAFGQRFRTSPASFRKDVMQPNIRTE
jgi:AraC family transcriptional regulator, melibiose operon regulatory protein